MRERVQVERDLSGMSEKEKTKLLLHDAPELTSLLADFKTYMKLLRQQLLPAREVLLTPSHPHTLTPSYPHTLTPSRPRTLVPAHCHALLPLSSSLPLSLGRTTAQRTARGHGLPQHQNRPH